MASGRTLGTTPLFGKSCLPASCQPVLGSRYLLPSFKRKARATGPGLIAFTRNERDAVGLVEVREVAEHPAERVAQLAVGIDRGLKDLVADAHVIRIVGGTRPHAQDVGAGLLDDVLRLDLGEGRGFYGIIGVATLGGLLLCFAPMDPVKELFWAAVLNGVVALPIMAVMMLLARRREMMNGHQISRRLSVLGWLATAAMAITVLAMLITF